MHNQKQPPAVRACVGSKTPKISDYVLRIVWLELIYTRLSNADSMPPSIHIFLNRIVQRTRAPRIVWKKIDL